MINTFVGKICLLSALCISALFVVQVRAAYADQTYCNSEGKSQIVYLIPRASSDKEERKRYQQALIAQIKSLNVGDHISLFAATEAGIIKRFEGCMPGCPPQGLLGQFLGLGGSCAVTRAQAAKQSFGRSYVGAATNIMDPSAAGSNDVLATLSSVSKHLQNTKNSKGTAVVISSMSDVAAHSEKSLDSWFVQTVQNNKIPTQFPAAEVSGLAMSAPLISFWEDMYSIRKQSFKYF